MDIDSLSGATSPVIKDSESAMEDDSSVFNNSAISSSTSGFDSS